MIDGTHDAPTPSVATPPAPSAPEPSAPSDRASTPASMQAPASAPLEPAARSGLEALLFIADEPISAEAVAAVLEADVDDVTDELHRLATEYDQQQRGISVRERGGGWRMYTADVAKPVVERWAMAGRTGRLTQAALETLAVIAYKQPISRQDIGEIRGVNADGAVRNLVARGLVEEAGRDDGPGQAVLYGTTTSFLERIGVSEVSELPALTDFLPEAPAPDEPELGTLREVRRRLSAGDELPSRGIGGRSAAQTNTGASDRDTDDDAMSAPTPRAPREDGLKEMDELAERLDDAARNAVGRLRGALAAVEERDRVLDADDDDAAAGAAEHRTPDGSRDTSTGSDPDIEDEHG